jgi:hypothetical protein
MNAGSTIFSQLIGFLSHYEFQKSVSSYDGEHKVKSFSCWDQYFCWTEYCRGRNADRSAPPAQIRTGAASAYGSYLGCMASNCTFGKG